MKTSLVVLAVSVLSIAAACGGKKQAKEPLKDDDSSSSGFSEDAKDGGGGSDSDGGSSSAAADSTPITVSCVPLPTSCSELTVPGPEAAASKDRCLAAGGEPHDSACARDNLVGTCLIEAKNVTLFYYRDADPQVTKGLVSQGAKACKGAGGAWTPAKAEGKKPPGKGKPKPKKK